MKVPTHLGWQSHLVLFWQQLWQLGDVGGDAPRLILAERLGGRARPGRSKFSVCRGSQDLSHQ
jgi:hypothetical protein